MLERIYALRTPAPSELSLERSRGMAIRWGCAVVESTCDLRDNGGQTIVHRCSDGGALLFFSEPTHPYVVSRISGEAPFVDDVSCRCSADVWTRDELLVMLTRTDPPVASLLVTVAMVTDVLDLETVEFFVRALEASDASTRKEAIVAISLVPAVAFAPALRVALGKERDPKLSAMIQNVLRMCEG